MKPNELHEAASDAINGHEKLKALFEQEEKIDINAFHTKDHTRAVDFAAQLGSVRTLDYLIKQQANIDAINVREEGNLFSWSRDNPNKKAMVLYLTDPTTRIYEKFNDGTTAIHAAAYAGDSEQIKKILDQNPSSIEDINIRGETVFFWAAMSEEDVVDTLLKHDAYCKLPQKRQSALFDILISATVDEGRYHAEEDDPIQAAKYYEKALRYVEKIPVKQDAYYHYLAIIKHDLALAYAKQNQLDEAKKILEQARQDYQKIIQKDARTLEWLTKTYNTLMPKYTLIAEAKAWGYTCEDVARDGECLFLAMVAQIQQQEIVCFADFTSHYLRTLAIAHIACHQEYYENCTLPDFETYLQIMSQPKEWADNLIILALSRALNVSFIIINSDQSSPIIIKQIHPVATFYLGYEVGIHPHYQLLIKQPNAVNSKNTTLEALYKKAETINFASTKSPAKQTRKKDFLTATAEAAEAEEKEITDITSGNSAAFDRKTPPTGTSYSPLLFSSNQASCSSSPMPPLEDGNEEENPAFEYKNGGF